MTTRASFFSALLGGVLLLSTVALVPREAGACAVAGPPADAIFRARVVVVSIPLALRLEPRSGSIFREPWKVLYKLSGDETVTTFFRVSASWRGAPTEYVAVDSPAYSMIAEEGTEYLVYADHHTGRYTVGRMCSSTGFLPWKELPRAHLLALGEATSPLPGGSPPPAPSLLGLFVALGLACGAGGLVWFWVRRTGKEGG